MLDKIAEILNDFRGKEDIVITEETTFAEMDLDSLDVMELIVSLEAEFDITISNDAELLTIGDLIKHIEGCK